MVHDIFFIGGDIPSGSFPAIIEQPVIKLCCRSEIFFKGQCIYRGVQVVCCPALAPTGRNYCDLSRDTPTPNRHAAVQAQTYLT